MLQAHPTDVSHSRQAIKKYVKANNKITITSEAQFDSMFNKALKSGVDKGDFTQPKGMLNSVPYLSRQLAVPCLGLQSSNS
jgi:histone H1/5